MASSLTFHLILLLDCSLILRLEGEACIPGILSSSPLKVGIKVVRHYAQILDGFLIRERQGLLPTEPPSQPPAPSCFE